MSAYLIISLFFYTLLLLYVVCGQNKIILILILIQCREYRGWLSHGLVVTLPISYSLDGGTQWGFTRGMRIAD